MGPRHKEFGNALRTFVSIVSWWPSWVRVTHNNCIILFLMHSPRYYENQMRKIKQSTENVMYWVGPCSDANYICNNVKSFNTSPCTYRFYNYYIFKSDACHVIQKVTSFKTTSKSRNRQHVVTAGPSLGQREGGPRPGPRALTTTGQAPLS